MATVPTPVPAPAKKAKKVQPEKHTIQLQFTTSADIDLFNRMTEEADADRRPLPLYALLALHEHYGKIDSQSE